MIINLNLLPVSIDRDFEVPSRYYANTDIKELHNIHAKGRVYYNLSDEVEIELDVTGEMILTDSITLKDIKEDINLKISQNLQEMAGESAYFYEKDKNTLDIIEFLWENIVLEVPISRTMASGSTMEGNGWSLNKADDEEKIDERFLKLNDYFKGGE